eukprot:6176103-Pleurochrysis_carterae.AAC.1
MVPGCDASHDSDRKLGIRPDRAHRGRLGPTGLRQVDSRSHSQCLHACLSLRCAPSQMRGHATCDTAQRKRCTHRSYLVNNVELSSLVV